jgi:acetylornithine/succinyldiaminopimelate/putrescine aminotransferase
VTLAKGLANGIPIGATITRDNIAKSFGKGDHGSTFGGNPVACKAANFTVDYIIKRGLINNAALQGSYLLQKLHSIKSKYIKEIRGKGLMVGMEIKKNAEKIQKKCMDKGLLVNLTAEKVLRFLPPLTISRDAINDALEILDEVIKNED